MKKTALAKSDAKKIMGQMGSRSASFGAADAAPVDRREQRERETAHFDPSSEGERYDRASARCSGNTSGDPASAATVRATRDTRARPRPESGSRSTARARSSAAAAPSAGVVA